MAAMPFVARSGMDVSPRDGAAPPVYGPPTFSSPSQAHTPLKVEKQDGRGSPGLITLPRGLPPGLSCLSTLPSSLASARDDGHGPSAPVAELQRQQQQDRRRQHGAQPLPE